MLEVIGQIERILNSIYRYIDINYKKNPEKFVSPEEFAVPIPEDTYPEVIDCFKALGWNFVKGGPEDDCNFLRFK